MVGPELPTSREISTAHFVEDNSDWRETENIRTSTKKANPICHNTDQLQLMGALEDWRLRTGLRVTVITRDILSCLPLKWEFQKRCDAIRTSARDVEEGMKGLLAAGSGRGLGESFEWCGDEPTFGDYPNSISATACLGGGKRRSTKCVLLTFAVRIPRRWDASESCRTFRDKIELISRISFFVSLEGD